MSYIVLPSPLFCSLKLHDANAVEPRSPCEEMCTQMGVSTSSVDIRDQHMALAGEEYRASLDVWSAGPGNPSPMIRKMLLCTPSNNAGKKPEMFNNICVSQCVSTDHICCVEVCRSKRALTLSVPPEPGAHHMW